MEKIKKNELIYIIVLTYNDSEDTIKCLTSLKNNIYSKFKIVVVDNNSEFDTISEIKEKHPDVEYLQLKKNYGYAGGNNRGIKYAIDQGASYVLIINNDTLVKDNFLLELVKSIKTNDKVAIVSPKIYKYPNKNELWYFKGKIDWYKGMGYNIDNDALNSEMVNQDMKTNFASGCCMLMDIELLAENNVQLLEEDYFLYFEDNDFSSKVIDKNMDLIFCPNSVIYHKVSASTSNDDSPILTYYFTRNRLLFMKRNHPSKYIYIRFLLFFYLTRIIKVIQWLPQKRTEHIKFLFKGIKDFYINNLGAL